MSNPRPESPARLFWFRLSAPNPFLITAVVFVLCLLAAPLIWYPFDVESCWLPWSRASEGVAPWRIYHTRPDCNYPPFVLYVLTAQEAFRRLLHAPETGAVSIVLTKLPNIVAHLAGALAGYFLLRRDHGETYARRFALLYALSLPLFVNAALWGQADALLALPMLCAVLFLMRGDPIPAGIALGIALTVKLQAVVIAPALLLYAGRRFGWERLAHASLAGIAVIAAISLPYVVAGEVGPMLKAYTGAADYYKLRTLNTFNIWAYFNYVDEYVKHVPGTIVNKDDRPAIGPLTYRDVSLVLFGTTLSILLACLWRRTTPRMLAWTAALSVWAFVTLCTQMHERYWVPGAVLFLLVAPESWFGLGVGLLTGFTAAWNQWLVLLSNFQQYHKLPLWAKWTLDTGWAPSLTYVSLLNVLLLIAGMGVVGWLAARPAEDTASENPESDSAAAPQSAFSHRR